MRTAVIDLFAGPGGLGEGFASLNDGQSFSITVSAEMDAGAHATLLLRSFFRQAKLQGDEQALKAYYDFCASATTHPKDICPKLWALAAHEARQLTLGDRKSNAELDAVLADSRLIGDSTVLVGGPPCQAYSLVGRARNKGTSTYVPEEDHRHFLYKEYLRILAKVQPAVFVMENVKGILTSKVGGRAVFADILTDLSDPLKATQKRSGPKYRIYSLSKSSFFEAGMDVAAFDPRDFIVRAEDYGIPQKRHRVILLGVREDLTPARHPLLQPTTFPATVLHAIEDLPRLRSQLKKGDSARAWHDKVEDLGLRLAKQADSRDPRIAEALRESVRRLGENLTVGALRFDMKWPRKAPTELMAALADDRLRHWLNHEARSHMDSDLGRYLYAATFTRLNRRSPKGHAEFNLKGLAPAHANWKTGKFADRFRVQKFGAPSTTVTSHISKDGHYFIHPDASQCRSLTVREAARLQTFPDNYFFQGNRTQQFHQVGNAVPPLLASQIAQIVDRIVRGRQIEQMQQSQHRALSRQIARAHSKS